MLPGRYRGIKPEFWTDSKVVQVTPYARLLFIGMWNFADDNGLLWEDPIALKLKVLPMDAVDCCGLIEELIQAGLVHRSETDEGRRYLVIRQFTKHQRVDPRFPRSIFTPSQRERDVATARSQRANDVSRQGNTHDSDSDSDSETNLVAPTSDDVGAPTVDWSDLEEVRDFVLPLCEQFGFSDLVNPTFWRHVDALCEGTQVYYLDEFRKYATWWQTRPPSSRHRNRRKGFLNWIKTEMGRADWRVKRKSFADA